MTASEDINRARQILARLCEEGLVQMSIPVRQDDEDMVLSRVIALAATPVAGNQDDTQGPEPIHATPAMSFEEWHSKHGPNGAAYDIEMQRAGWNGAVSVMQATPVAAQPATLPPLPTAIPDGTGLAHLVREYARQAVYASEARAGYRIYKDGDQWCAVGPGFIDLQQSPAGFAETPGEALEALMKEFGKEWWAKNGEWVKRHRAYEAAAVETVKDEPPQWIDDPHDIEQGQMINPAWRMLKGLTAKEAALTYAPPPRATMAAEPVAPAKSGNFDPQPPGWVQCPECLAGFPLADAIRRAEWLEPVAPANLLPDQLPTPTWHQWRASPYTIALQGEIDALRVAEPVEGAEPADVPAMYSMGRLAGMLAEKLTPAHWAEYCPDIHNVCHALERAPASAQAAPSIEALRKAMETGIRRAGGFTHLASTPTGRKTIVEICAREAAHSRGVPAKLDDAFEVARAALFVSSDRASIRHILEVLRARVDATAQEKGR